MIKLKKKENINVDFANWQKLRHMKDVRYVQISVLGELKQKWGVIVKVNVGRLLFQGTKNGAGLISKNVKKGFESFH